jgi:hypothetical protein
MTGDWIVRCRIDRPDAETRTLNKNGVVQYFDKDGAEAEAARLNEHMNMLRGTVPFQYWAEEAS